MSEPILPFSDLPTGIQGTVDEGYSSQKIYVRNQGVLQIPISEDESGNDGECVFVKMSQEWGKMYLIFQASAINKVPDVPHPESNNPNEILLNDEIGISEPILMPSGSVKMVIHGKYTYALVNAPSPADGYTSPRTEYMPGKPSVNISEQNFGNT